MKYAKDVLLATAQEHRAPLGPALSAPLRSDSRRTTRTTTLKLGYPSSHTYALDAVPAGARVLDIGAGPGGMARELVKKGCEVTVVDQYPATAAATDVAGHRRRISTTRRASIASDYDYLLLLDIIEHLRDPEQFLEQLRAQLDYEPRTLVLTTPNVAFLVQRFMLLFGQFNYGKAGILDRDHTRLFTFRSLKRLLRDAGFSIKEVRGVPAPFPKVLGDGVLGRAALAVNLALIRARAARCSRIRSSSRRRPRPTSTSSCATPSRRASCARR